MINTKLFSLLPEADVSTPDGMAIDSQDRLYLACPNFADTQKIGCIYRFEEMGKPEKWFELPPLDETGLVCPMGIAFDDEGDLFVIDNQSWLGSPELKDKGRILKLHIRDDKVVDVTTIASGMEHPNGMRIREGKIYITQSSLSKIKISENKLVSGVYCFGVNDNDVKVTNTASDDNLIATFITHDPDCQYGVDGIEFDHNGDLLIGNFGDGAVYRLKFDIGGNVIENIIWAQDRNELQTTDGMVIDELGNLYIADFSANSIARVSKDGKVKRIAYSPDTNGFNGELDQPGEPAIWKGKIVVSCFDLVTDPDKVNTAHELPATVAYLDLREAQNYDG